LFTIGMSFNSLYQINPEHLVLLGYASITGTRKDFTGSAVPGGMEFSCRLLGNFNETYNVPVTIDSVARAVDAVELFSGISFNESTPFVAPRGAQILMPPTFQVEVNPSSTNQAVTGDFMVVLCTIGYEIERKKRF